jgi:hypothetical protein
MKKGKSRIDMIRDLMVLLFIFLITVPLAAQQTKRSSGTYQVRVEDNMTKEEARRKAEELAKINAIENAFGQYVGQETKITVQDGRSNFNIIGNVRVKGEWVRTLGVPTFDEVPREEKGTFGTVQSLWITCNIRGVVKEATPKANIQYFTLNFPDSRSRTTTFVSGENFYLWFKSPVDGFLSVYVDDGENVYRLVPYDGMSAASTVIVEADKPYIFFSPDSEHNYFGNNVDELVLITPKKSELNTLHILFSERDYFKPVLTEGYKMEDGTFLPKSLTRNKFENWLADNKTRIPDFLDAQVHIEILREK